LLSERESPLLTEEKLTESMGLSVAEQARDIFLHARKLGWVQSFEEPRSCPEGSLERVLPDLLKMLSLKGKVLLADPQGFYVSSSGFPHEVAEELSGLSADLASLHTRRSGLLENNLGLAGGAWALVDAAGNGRIGFWPVFIGANRFVLVVSGVPQFNCPDFVKLAWVLSLRYLALPA
jgi:hypothetical protein